MTELDFIPQWYRASRNRKLWHQRQCVMIGLAVAAMACGFMAAGRSLAVARAELTVMRKDFELGISKIQQFRKLQSELDELQKNAKMLEMVSPRTPYTATLAELTHCINSNVILGKLTIQSVPMEFLSQNKTGRQKQNRIQVNSGSSAALAMQTPVQTELILRGVALDGSTVAVLIAALERSEYFCRVIPGYSKNTKVRDVDVSEFEVRCVLADFEAIP